MWRGRSWAGADHQPWNTGAPNAETVRSQAVPARCGVRCFGLEFCVVLFGVSLFCAAASVSLCLRLVPFPRFCFALSLAWFREILQKYPKKREESSSGDKRVRRREKPDRNQGGKKRDARDALFSLVRRWCDDAMLTIRALM